MADMKTVYRKCFTFHTDRLAALDRGDPDFAADTVDGVKRILRETDLDPLAAKLTEAIMADLALQSGAETRLDLWRRFTALVNRELESLVALEGGDGGGS